MSICPERNETILTFPSNSASGLLQFFNISKLQTIDIIQAHKTLISCIAISNDGKLVATASEKVELKHKCGRKIIFV